MLLLFGRAKAYYESLSQRQSLERLEKAINGYAILVATVMEMQCANGFDSCQNTKLYPEVVDGRRLVFRMDRNIAQAVLPAIMGKIPCSLVSTEPLTYDCMNINVVNMFYMDGEGNTSTNIQPSNFFDYRQVWELIVEYDEKGLNRNIPHRLNGHLPPFRLSLLESYTTLGKRTMDKMAYLKDLLKNYATTKRFQEFNNVPNLSTGIGGLVETDDFSIPWVWQVLSRVPEGVYYVCRDMDCLQFCRQLGDGSVDTSNCLPVSQVWEGNNLNSMDILDRIRRNLSVPSDINIGTDGFGNRIQIELIANGITPPPPPGRDYSYTRPPFITNIFVPFCRNSSRIVYDCFVSFTYPQ